MYFKYYMMLLFN